MNDEPYAELDRIQAAIAAAGAIVYDWDLVADSLHWSGDQSWLKVLGHVPAASGEHFAARIHPDDLPLRQQAIAELVGRRQRCDLEYRMRGEGGKIQWVQEHATAEFDPDDRAVRVVGMLRVITARKQRESQLEYLASFDELTGHFNRCRLKDALDHALAFALRYRTPGAYLVIGIDSLTTISEAFGYATADAVIIGVGQRLDRCLRASDVVGRVGGDCYGIVLGQCPDAEIATTAEKILQAVSETPVDTPNGAIYATVSVGGIALGPDSPPAHEVMSRADSALQEAKRAGRNCFVRFRESEEHRESRRRLIATTEKVQAALKTGRLVFAYQPIVETATRVVDHYECLLRLRQDDGSLLSAGAFVPAVEQSGLMRVIDRRTLELAVEELCCYPSVRLAINISGLTAADRAWLRTLQALLKGRPDVACRLIIEITETVALQDLEDTARFVAAVRDLGCMVALDDFGAGYTSFRHLKSLSVDCVKIDGSFVSDLAHNVDNQLFIRSLMSLADGFGLATVAECVETAAEASYLARYGVRFLQGYYFGRPSPERPWAAPAPMATVATLRGSASTAGTRPRLATGINVPTIPF